jgi:hypothetical protein
VATVVERNAKETGGASGDAWRSLRLVRVGGQTVVFIGAFGKNLASFAVAMVLHLIYFMKNINFVL